MENSLRKKKDSPYENIIFSDICVVIKSFDYNYEKNEYVFTLKILNTRNGKLLMTFINENIYFKPVVKLIGKFIEPKDNPYIECLNGFDIEKIIRIDIEI